MGVWQAQAAEKVLLQGQDAMAATMLQEEDAAPAEPEETDQEMGEVELTPCGKAQEEWSANVWMGGVCSQAVAQLDSNGKCAECTSALPFG